MIFCHVGTQEYYFSCIYRSKSHRPKESIEMVKCEAYEAVNISRHISEAQAEGEYETIM